MNLPACLPPSTASPPSVFKSLTCGQLIRHWTQNSDPKDHRHFANSFCNRLLARGHEEEDISKMFNEASAPLNRKKKRRKVKK